MQMLCSRTIPFLDSQSLALSEAREVLFRKEDNTFVLYLSDGAPSSGPEERIIILETREALIWLNEPSQEQGSFWN
jgi:hypothetical protein